VRSEGDGAVKLRKIISGGQTGADRAGLDAGLHLGLATGGWVPKGRITEAGLLSDEQMERYGLVEHPSAGYEGRTRANVRDSHGTIIFGRISSPGSRLTLQAARNIGRPYLLNPTPAALREWLNLWDIEVLNVAGNRSSSNPGVYELTFNTLVEALRQPEMVDMANDNQKGLTEMPNAESAAGQGEGGMPVPRAACGHVIHEPTTTCERCVQALRERCEALEKEKEQYDDLLEQALYKAIPEDGALRLHVYATLKRLRAALSGGGGGK